MRIFTNLGLWGWSWAQQFRILPVLAEYCSSVRSLHPAVHNYLGLRSASSPTWKPKYSHHYRQLLASLISFSSTMFPGSPPPSGRALSTSSASYPVPTMPAMTSSFEVLINASTTKLVNAVNIDEPHGRPQLQVMAVQAPHHQVKSGVYTSSPSQLVLMLHSLFVWGLGIWVNVD